MKILKNILTGICDKALKSKVYFCDVRLLDSVSTAIEIEDGQADKINLIKTKGVGVRVLQNGAWGFSSTNYVDKQNIERCLEDAISTAKAIQGKKYFEGVVYPAEPVTDTVKTAVLIDPRTVSLKTKLHKLQMLETEGRLFNPAIINTFLFYFDGISKQIICNTFGTYIETETIRTNVSFRAVAKDADVRQMGYESIGRLEGFELIESLSPKQLTIKASEKAVRLLSASFSPAGKFPVIFDSSVTGLLVHEAFGHNSEADGVWTGESIIADKMGQKIASELVTIIDDSTLNKAWGTYVYDSEGIPSSRKILVENGVVKNFLHSLETASRFGVKPTGNARAQNHQFQPIVRMSNTFIAPGTTLLEEIVKGVDFGIMAQGAVGGYVATEKGHFTCKVAEGRIIKNGEFKEHIRDVAVSGLTLEALKNIDAVSNNFSLSMPGICGKMGQGVPVDDGGPHIRIKELVVGGRT